jgi:hypothetical protein
MTSSTLNQIEDDHVKKAWEYVFHGVPPEQAADVVLPPGDGPVGSMNRGVYRFALVTVLSRKKLLFARAMDAARTGGDWRRAFRGKRTIFWPTLKEREQLGFDDVFSHLTNAKEPYEGRDVVIRVRVNHSEKTLESVEVLLPAVVK